MNPIIIKPDWSARFHHVCVGICFLVMAYAIYSTSRKLKGETGKRREDGDEWKDLLED